MYIWSIVYVCLCNLKPKTTISLLNNKVYLILSWDKLICGNNNMKNILNIKLQEQINSCWHWSKVLCSKNIILLRLIDGNNPVNSVVEFSYSFSLRGDLRSFVHSFDPWRVGRSGPQVSFQLLHLRLQRTSAGLALHLVHVHVQLVPLLLCTLRAKQAFNTHTTGGTTGYANNTCVIWHMCHHISLCVFLCVFCTTLWMLLHWNKYVLLLCTNVLSTVPHSLFMRQSLLCK